MTARSTVAAACVALSLGLLAACGSGGETSGAPVSSTQRVDPPGGSGTSGGPDTTTVPTGEPTVTGTVAATLEAPIDLVARPGDDHLWVAERAGTIRRLTVSGGGRTLDPDGEPVLDLTSQTTTDVERGLLGIAFSADGRTLYVSHTDPDGDTRLVSYAVSGEGTVDGESRKVLLAVDQPYPNHNGGHVLMGPDGKIWFGLGDGGAADDPQNRAQNPRTFLGKIVRLDPDGGRPEIVISGVRNPWRLSFDTDGSLWIGDVGQNAWEEVNHLAAGKIDGTNLGWSTFEGTHPNPNVKAPGRTGQDPVPPVFEYSHANGNCSITGGFVYHGKDVPSLDGAYLFADYCAGRVRALRLDANGKLAAEYDLGVAVASPISFGTDADGEAYVLSGTGTITRLVDAG